MADQNNLKKQKQYYTGSFSCFKCCKNDSLSGDIYCEGCKGLCLKHMCIDKVVINTFHCEIHTSSSLFNSRTAKKKARERHKHNNKRLKQKLDEPIVE